ncbi:MAG: PH domain-containing protein [Phycisphaerae bacterium]
MQCPGCRKPIADESKFCQHCGVPISAARQVAGGRSNAPAATPAPVAPVVADAPMSPGAARSAALDPANEKPVREFRPAWRGFLGQWLVWLLAVTFVFGASFMAGFDRNVWTWVVGLVVIAAAVVALRQCWSVYRIQYRLTTQRLFVIRGLLARTTDQLELLRVDDVRVRQGLIERMLNIGSIELITSDPTDKDLVLHKIDTPGAIAEEVRSHTRRIRARQMLYVENVGGDAPTGLNPT